jgi:eukaryotic-like serine/threonine-protein kinase
MELDARESQRTLGLHITLKECVGEGAFGAVFRAEDRRSGSEVAVKVLKPEWEDNIDVLIRFLNETKVARRSLSGICRYFGIGRLPTGQLCIVMEWLRGETLSAAIQRDRFPRSIDAPTLEHLASDKWIQPGVISAVVIVRHIARLLAELHKANIVHRDLKPDNIFLVPDPLVEGEVRPIILDLGISHLGGVGLYLTKKNEMMGTAYYAAPEQLSDAADVNPSSDLYALGACLYEMVTKKPPFFEVESMLVLLARKAAGDFTPASRVATDVRGRGRVSACVDALIHKLMSPEPGERLPGLMDTLDGCIAELKRGAAEEADDNTVPADMREIMEAAKLVRPKT